ncbi:MAG: hypothetical protein PHC97_01475 [Patescibacteria group bacterium]|nr:hypothetical protein [Patescibacteria group bacterium]
MVFAIGLVTLMVVTRKKRGINQVSGFSATNLYRAVVDPAELKERARTIKIMNKRLRWARHRLEQPHLCKKAKLKRALRYIQEAHRHELSEIRSCARTLVNLFGRYADAKIRHQLDMTLKPSAPAPLTSKSKVEELIVSLANAA